MEVDSSGGVSKLGFLTVYYHRTVWPAILGRFEKMVLQRRTASFLNSFFLLCLETSPSGFQSSLPHDAPLSRSVSAEKRLASLC